ncbi:MFS transporter [Dongia deserti]|uniref:MFS transporter n=1 Tax=Dongia deserti TaxID=2268030 RepID=UPI0013C42112|nr:MFS transporter [Dongia deserti]
MTTQSQYRAVFLLAVAQALANSCMSVFMTVSALTGQMLAADPRWATLPLSLQFVMTMATAMPVAQLMRALSRRNAFFIGAFVGAAGGALAMLAVFQNSFVLFCVGNAIMGASNSFALQLRFAVAEVADDAFRPKAISLVLAGGIVAAIIGPRLAQIGTDLFAPFTFAGAFMFVALLSLAMIPPIAPVRFPQPTEGEIDGQQRPILEILRQPIAIAALFAGVFGYSTMIFVMTATPLAMKFCGFGIGDTATVLSFHILGMFAPSFVTGHIIRRIGERKVLLTGAACMIATVMIGLAGIDILNFWLALVLLGLGWNFLFVGGTSLLTTCYRPAERAKVQGTNDFLTFTGVAICSLIAGAVEQSWGWDAVLWGSLAPTILILIAVLWGAPRFSKAAPVTA